MSDTLETMFQNPVTALWAGQREGMGNLKAQSALAHEQQQLQDLIQAHAQKNLTNPLDVQKLRLGNQGLEAGLPGITADSRKKTIDAETAAQTQKGAIAETNSKNELSLLEHNLKRNDALVDLLGKGSEQLKQLPPAARHAAAYQQLFKMGGQEAVDAWKDKLDSINGEKLPDVIGALAQHSAMGSVGMRQKLAEIKAHTTSNETIAKGNNATQLAISNNKIAAAAKAKQGVANIRNAIQSGKMNFEQAAAAFRGASLFETDPELKALYETEADAFAKKVGEKGVAGKPNTDQLGIPSNQITPFGTKDTDKAKPLTMAEKRAALAGK